MKHFSAVKAVCFEIEMILTVQQDACACRQQHQINRIDVFEKYQQAGNGKNSKGIFIDEIFAVHQHNGRAEQQPDDGNAQPFECILNNGMRAVFLQKQKQQSRYNDGRRADAQGRHNRAEDGLRAFIADIGRGVDCNRSGGYLRNRNDVRKFSDANPRMFVDDFVLNEGEHRISAAETEQPDFKERVKQFPKNHFFRPYTKLPMTIAATMNKIGDTL